MAAAIWTDSQIIGQLDSGYHWSGTSWTYAFPTTSSWFRYTEATGFSPLTAAQQAKATLAITLWDELIVPRFTATSDPNTANIKFSNTTTDIGYAHAYYPGYGDTAYGSVWFNSNYNTGTNNLIPPSIGQWGWAAFVHETGHAVGVSHPGDYNGGSPTYANDALYTHDSQQYTIMSYFMASNTGADWVASDGRTYFAQTPMIDDIMAIQAMYGADYTTRAGDTVYGFNSNITGITADIYNFSINLHPIIAIWDGGGNDTLNFSGWNTPSLINLTPGSFSNADMMTYNISIARGAWIENAIGGGGNDTLIGNILGNGLTGNAGNDSFTGGGGNDYIYGGDGTTDMAVYSGNFSDYSISWNGVAYVLVDNRAGGADGTDTVKDVEKFAFADQTVDAASLIGSSATNFALAVSGGSSANENGGSVTFTITRSGDSTAAGSVNYTVAGSGANPANSADFSSAMSGTVNFAAGETSKTVTVTFAGDSVSEANEGFTVTLSNASSGSGITTATASGTILNDDIPPPSLAIAATSASKAEGNSGATAFTFTVTRSGDLTGSSSANYTIAGASVGDFSGALTGTVSFAAGESSKVVTIYVVGDTTAEASEGFTVTLSGATNATLGTASAGGTILNDDYQGTVGNDAINLGTSTLNNGIDVSQGGTDSVTGGSGQDTIVLGAALNAGDVINGGTGSDSLLLQGDYSAGLVFGSVTMSGVERLVLGAGYNYNLTLNNGNVANSDALTVDASALGAVNAATVNAAAERGGRITFLGGAGNDVFTGGRGADNFTGNGGADRQTGGTGADVFLYKAASDSMLVLSGGTILTTGADTLVSFSASADKIDLSAFGFGINGGIVERTVASFTGTAAAGNTFFGAGNEVVVEYGASSTARVYVDANGNGGLDSSDMMIQLTGVSAGALSATNFKF